MRQALIDGDTFVYASTTATEQAINWGDGMWTLHGFLPEATEHFDALVREVRDAVEADEVIIALSCAGQKRWREGIMPTYKAQRKEKRKPLLYGPIREHCHETYKTLERPKLEGDDILGILATHPDLALTKGSTSRICVSLDKDLKTIPGEHYDYYHKKFFSITEAEANYWHFIQSVMGDTTDGYPGCPGVGPVSAKKLLDPFLTEDGFDAAGAWAAIVAAYEKKGLCADVALLNARVARICRHTDYDLDKKEVILWQPPK